MRMWWVIFAMAITIACAGTANAGDYRIVSINKNQMTIVDPSTIERAGSGLVRAWSVGLRAPGKELKGASVVKIRFEVDCGGRRARAIDSAFYDASYSFVTSNDTPSAAWMAVIPDSQGEAFHNFVCSPPSKRNDTAERLAGLTLAEIIRRIYAGPWPAN